MAQTRTQIREHLAAFGLHPKHRFGQNFLHDQNKMRQICEAADLSPNELILEVGAGTGALSEQLLDAGCQLIAVEVDEDLQPILESVYANYEGRTTLLLCDVLDGKHELSKQVVSTIDGRPFKLIANLPYNVASPLLVNLALQQPNMTAGIVMVQKEVADRLVAGPGSKAYGPLGILLQTRYAMRTLTTLSPGCFWPEPKVASAVVVMKRLEQPLVDDLTSFGEFVHHVFHRRRKQLGAILGRDFPFPDVIEPNARPDALSMEQLLLLHSKYVEQMN